LSYANQAVSVAAEQPADEAVAWGVRAQILSMVGEPLPEPPGAVAEAEKYQLALAEAAAERHDWDKVLDVTGPLLSRGDRSTEALFLCSNALVAKDEAENRPIGNHTLIEVERLTSELIDNEDDDTVVFVHKAYVLRANVRRLLGRAAEGQADLERARHLAEDDPDAIASAVQWRLEDGDYTEALKLLQGAAVQRNARLLALRARVRANLSDQDEARVDLDAAMRQLHNADEPMLVRLEATEAFLQLKDANQAELVLKAVTGDTWKARRTVLSARLAFVKGDIEQGTQFYHEAAGLDAKAQAKILAELGSQLLRARRPAAAIEAFEAAGETNIPGEALPLFAQALLQAREYPRAQKLIDGLVAKGSLPDWALNVAIEVAMLREDTEAAVRNLRELTARQASSVRAKLALAHFLVELGNLEEAKQTVLELAADKTLPPFQRALVAELLGAVGQERTALEVMFRAFRDNPQDPRLHRALIVLALSSRVPPEEIDEVGPETHVRLQSEDGETRGFTIYAEAPIDPLRGEITVTDANAKGLLGRRVGDVVISHDGTWQEQRWKVVEILPAFQYALMDAMTNFSDRFPGEPFLLAALKIGDESSIKFLAPIITVLEGRNASAENVLRAYRELVVPLGLVAKALGSSIAEAMAAMRESDPQAPLFVEWSDRASQLASVGAATSASDVILTRSGLETAFRLGLLDALEASFGLVAPRSLRDDLRREVKAARMLTTQGQKAIVMVDHRPTLLELEPGDPRLQRRLDDSEALLAWLEKVVRLEARPLEAIRKFGSEQEERRSLLGHSAFDSLVLSEGHGSLYADDLGLRKCLVQDARLRSFSTVALIAAFSQKGVVTAEAANEHLLTLVESGYAFVMPSGSLLQTAMRRSTALTRTQLGRVFSLLGGPTTTADESARIASEVIRSVATAQLLVIEPEEVAELALEGMATRWPRALCGLLLAEAVTDQLGLLPQVLDRVRRVCTAFTKAK
jgi:tetratricopeptide (TPR) repeat protein